ncbi:hypothetical protein GGQ84_002064 [Desulfitispora alkaliphila]|uniref:DUF3786 domain-containing protein n=1 Tax=Desulfitispora alkaliphila TaxID=622674 RepID=UPI003D1A77E9
MDIQANKNYNLDNTYAIALQKLLSMSFDEIAWKSGATYDENSGKLELQYLNGFVYLDQNGHMTFSDVEPNLQERIAILHYLCKADGAPRVPDKVISYKELEGGDIYIGPFTNRAINPLIKIFGENPKELHKLLEVWPGVKAPYGDFSIEVKVFPLVHIYYVLWEGDDEFPPNGNILFDVNTNNYLSTEDAAVIASNLVYKMPKL